MDSKKKKRIRFLLPFEQLGMSAVIREFAGKLIQGKCGEEVMRELRARETRDGGHYTLSSLNGIVSQIRSAVLERVQPVDAAYANLRTFSSDPEVAAFLSLSLKDQVAVQRSHSHSPSWSDAAEVALANLPLVPSNLKAFGLTPQEMVALKRQQEAALDKKQLSIVIGDAAKLLSVVTALLETASATRSVPALALPLLFACGRRSSELMSVDSAFSPTESQYWCNFSGVLKKRGAATTIRIPLLVPFSTFAVGLAALRSRQARNGESAGLTPAQIKCRYQPSLNRELTQRGLPGLPPCTVHTLRSVYATYVYNLFLSPYSLAKTGKLSLYHATLKESLHYNAIRLDNIGPYTHRNGTFHL